jgi:hypothetical protein
MGDSRKSWESLGKEGVEVVEEGWLRREGTGFDECRSIFVRVILRRITRLVTVDVLDIYTASYTRPA